MFPEIVTGNGSAGKAEPLLHPATNKLLMKLQIFRTIVLCLIAAITAAMACKKTAANEYRLTSIRVNNSSVTLAVGESFQLKATAVPAAANQPSFQWSSADNLIATVSNGLVKAISAGNTKITVSSSGISTDIDVSVAPLPVVQHNYDDTVLRMTLSGADCPFADHADYGVYIPTRTEPLRGVLVLQHGCGMEQFGITKPYDLQYRAFARKWKLAIVETALYGNCGGWRDPESGSATALLKVLRDAGSGTSHNELNTVPWLLWGHSGGGYWVLGMLRSYPERILAAVCYSPAFDPQWNYPAASSKVPLLTRHAGKNDANDNVVLCQATSIHAFAKLRDLDAPAGIALNESQNHNLSFIRYMAIPFYEAVLKQRLPQVAGGAMNDPDRNQSWLGDTLTMQLSPEAGYSGDKKGLCVFPDETTARNWKEYYTTGTVTDKTPPPAPFGLTVRKSGDGVELTWAADADIESGIERFEIFRDGVLAGRVPETGAYQSFDTNGDNTYPVQVPPMKFMLAGAANTNAVISVRTVNHFNLLSDKTEIQYVK
ncbi:MAG: hypothetical protein EOO05_06230 [Chitinophagaceae bacterium]|nr:MAG: hypothetical protein EOO05_06230 [Chitinophagaceae bacterium]